MCGSHTMVIKESKQEKSYQHLYVSALFLPFFFLLITSVLLPLNEQPDSSVCMTVCVCFRVAFCRRSFLPFPLVLHPLPKMLTDSDICSVFSPSIIHPSPSSPTHQAWVCTGGGGGMVARRLVKRGYLKQHDCPAGSTQITFACAIPSTFLCVYFTQGGHLEHSSYQSLSELFNSGNSEFHILQMRKRAIGTTHLLDQNKRDLAESYRASVCLPFCTLPVGGERFNTFSTFGLKQSKCQNDHSMV